MNKIILLLVLLFFAVSAQCQANELKLRRYEDKVTLYLLVIFFLPPTKAPDVDIVDGKVVKRSRIVVPVKHHGNNSKRPSKDLDGPGKP